MPAASKTYNNNFLTEHQKEVKKLKAVEALEHKIKQTRISDGFSLDYIRSAINQQQLGYFEQTTLIARKMLADEVYKASIDKRINGLLQAELDFEPSDSSDNFSIVIKDVIEKIWNDQIEETHLESFLRSYLNTGTALAYLTWDLKNGFYVPYFKNLTTEFLEYDQTQEKWLWRGYQSAPVVEVTPGYNNWVLLSAWCPGDVTGFVSQLSEAWFLKKLAMQDYLEANAKHVDNIAVIKKSTDVNSQYDQTSDIDTFALEIQTRKKNGVIFLPAGYDIEFEDAHSNYKPESFQYINDYWTKQARIAILGGNLSSDSGDTGSYAAANVHLSAEKNLIKSDAQKLSTCLKRQVIDKIIEYNFTSDYIDYSPWIKWKIAPADDLKAYTDTLNSAKGFLDGSGYKMANIPELMDHLGIEVMLPKVNLNDNKENNKEDDNSETEEASSEEDSTEDTTN